LPVDATVSSVQKILQNPTADWSSLMLSKVDEAAHPWALVKGLTENSLPVSWMAGDSRIAVQAQPFDPAVLVQLALSPMANMLGAEVAVQTPSEVLAKLAKQSVKPKKAASATVRKTKPSTPRKPNTRQTPPLVAQEVEIPALLSKSRSGRLQNRSNPSIPA
jgi:hypothetical protein